MHRKWIPIWAFAAALAFTPGAVGQYGSGAQSLGDSLDDDRIPEVGISQNLGAKLPLDATFRNELNQPVALREIFAHGKPVIIQLGYFECPMLCGEVLNGTLEALQGVDFNIGEDFYVASISIDPSESPSLAGQKKIRYAKAYGRDEETTRSGWYFLVGADDAIQAVADSTGFAYEYLPDIDQFAHGSAIIVATPTGELSRYFFGVVYPPQDVRMALLEASAGRIGSLVDAILLRCYMYDSVTGQYTLSVLRIVRLAGLITALAVVVLVLVLVGADRRRSGRSSNTKPAAAHH